MFFFFLSYMGCWPLRFPVINEWACALMCASHAEDGCCTYKDNAKRVDDENDGDNYEAPWGNEQTNPISLEEFIGLFTCILPLILLVRFFQPAPAKNITSKNTLVQQCLEGILPFFEASRLSQNFRDPVLSSHLIRQEDTGLCEFRAGFGGVDESQEEWSASQCRLDPGLRVGTNPCQSWRDPSNRQHSLSLIYVKTNMETENYSLGKRERSTKPPIFEGSMFL